MRALLGMMLAFFLSMAMPVGMASAGGLLDGRVFHGMIGPADDPDLNDSLYFDDGYFWSEICTRCGFVPGRYSARTTEKGIEFSGVLESESRGQFDYHGVVSDDGDIRVSIEWERKRWYWTSRREIVFEGESARKPGGVSLDRVRNRLHGIDPESNPACGNF